MATLPTLTPVSPLNADDGNYHTFTAGATESASFALTGVPTDLDTVNSLTWTVVNSRSAASGDDTISLSIRIMSGGTVLAAADAGGAYQTVRSNVTGTADTTNGPTSFSYVNTSASWSAWNNATVQIQQTYTQNMGPDGHAGRVDYVAINGDYTVYIPQEVFADPIGLNGVGGISIVGVIPFLRVHDMTPTSGTAVNTTLNNSTSVSDGNNPFSNTNNNGIRSSNAVVLTGSRSGYRPQHFSGQFPVVTWSVGSSDIETDVYMRAYYYIDGAYPSTRRSLFGIYTTSSILDESGHVKINTNGTISLDYGLASTAYTSSTVVPLNEWFAIEFYTQFNTANLPLQARIYTGDIYAGATPTETIGSAITTWSSVAATNGFYFGHTQINDTYAWFIEDIAVSDQDWPGLISEEIKVSLSATSSMNTVAAPLTTGGAVALSGESSVVINATRAVLAESNLVSDSQFNSIAIAYLDEWWDGSAWQSTEQNVSTATEQIVFPGGEWDDGGYEWTVRTFDGVNWGSYAEPFTVTVENTVAVSGAATLSGSGTLSATGTASRFGTSALDASAAVGSAGTISQFGQASHTGNATVAVSGTREQFGVTAISSSASQTVSATATALGSLAMAASATVTAAASLTVFATSTIASTGSQLVLGFLEKFGASTFTGTASQTVSGTLATTGSASLSATATTTTAGVATALGASTLAATASLTASTLGEIFGSATLPSDATLTASAAVSTQAIASMSANATQTVTSTVTTTGIVSVSGTATMNTIPGNIPPRAPTLVSPIGGVTIGMSGGYTFDWTHNDSDGDPQVAYRLVRRVEV